MDRRTIRYAAAAIAGVIAAMYFLIGLGVLDAVTEPTGGASLLMFGTTAGAAFLLGAVFLVLFDDRRLWAMGAVLQVAVVLGYLAVASERTPEFELWGVLLHLLQVPLFVALVYLALRPVDEALAGRT